jgi:hypothetical protein
MTVELFCHVTGDNKCSLFSTCIKARMDTSGHGLSCAFRTPRAFTNRLTDIKNSLVSVCLNLELNTLGLTVPQVEIKGLGLKGVLGFTSKAECLRTCVDTDFFPCFGKGYSLLKFVHLF